MLGAVSSVVNLVSRTGLVGAWGPIVFIRLPNRVMSYSEILRESEARWEEHLTVNSVPVSEFLGPGLDKCTMKIVLSSALGSIPSVEYELIRVLLRRGIVFPLIVGGFPLSLSSWHITDINGVSDVFTPLGLPSWMELTVSFKEYR